MALTNLASLPLFRHPPLEDASKEIRLLQILPAVGTDNDSNIISVRLVDATEVNATPYDALSYTWGDGTKTKPILVIGCRFGVTENLYAVLLQLRAYNPMKDRTKSDLFWIDAVCIDQKSDIEKSLQVQMMRDIFSRAVQLFVWLGTHLGMIRQGINAVNSLAMPYMDYMCSMHRDPSNAKLHYDVMLSRLKEFVKEDSSHNRFTTSIRNLFRLPWWDRVWIIQEVASNENVYVLLGDIVFDFKYFRYFYSIIIELNKIPASDVGPIWSVGISHIYSVIHRDFKVLKLWKLKNMSLLEALEMIFVVGQSQATNPRDRLYALKGLDVDVEAATGELNYSMPWQTLYTRVTRYLLKVEGIRSLSLCTPFRDRQHNGLPSWVPDWREYMPISIGVTSSSELFKACADSLQTVCDKNQGNELTLIGTRIARIDQVQSPFSLRSGTERTPSWVADFTAVRVWHDDIKYLVRSLQLPDDQKSQVILRTTSTDVCSKTKFVRLTPDDCVAYKAFTKILNSTRHDTSLEDLYVLDAAAASYYQRVLAVADGRRPFRSDKDHIGIAPEAADIGDIVCIIFGGTVPFVLRPEPDGRYRLLGEAYVDGIMDGQYMDTPYTVEEFVLC